MNHRYTKETIEIVLLMMLVGGIVYIIVKLLCLWWVVDWLSAKVDKVQATLDEWFTIELTE